MVGRDDLQVGAEHDQRLAHRLHDVLGVFPGILNFASQLFSFGDVFHGQKDDVRADVLPENLPGVQQNGLAADIEEIVFDFVAVEHRVVQQDIFKEVPQLGDVPLPVAEVVDEVPDGLLGGDPEGIVKAVVGGENLQVGIEHDQRFADGFHDVLGVFPGNLDSRFRLFAIGDVTQGTYGVPLTA